MCMFYTFATISLVARFASQIGYAVGDKTVANVNINKSVNFGWGD